MKRRTYITYKTSNYKYQLTTQYSIVLPVMVGWDIHDTYLRLNTKGILTIRQGYAWDGPSGGVPDTNENLRASLIHDALYQLLRAELIEPRFRRVCDQIFRDECVKDGVPKVMAKVYYMGLRMFGKLSAHKSRRKEIKTAPHQP